MRKLFPKNGFARNVSILVGGTAAGQVLVILASPVLTRLYGPEDFGLLAVYASLLTIGNVLTSLRYQVAIPLADDDQEGMCVVALSLVVVFALSLITVPFVLIFKDDIAAVFNVPGLADYLWLLPLGLALAGTYQVFNYWALRVRGFSIIARTKLTQAIGTLLIQIGMYSLGSVALLLGQISGQASGVTTLGALALRQRVRLFRAVTLADIWRVANRYRRFPLFSTWGTAFNIVGRQLPALLFAALFGPMVAGLYALSQRVMAIPSRLIGRAIGDVFFSEAATRKDNLGQLITKVHTKLTHIAVAPALLLVLVAPQLFALVFGAEWETAGRFAQWLTPAIYMAFVVSPLSRVFSVLGKHVHEIIFQGALLAVRACGLFIGAWLDEPMVGVALFAIGTAICYLVFLVWLSDTCSIKLWDLWGETVSAIGWAVLSTSPVIAVWLTGVGRDYWLLAFVLATAGIVATYMRLFRVVE
jgi:O-antigen/teichoic acid export membrane protein